MTADLTENAGREALQVPEAPEDRFLQADLERNTREDVPFEKLAGQTVFVTGATGLVGSLFIRTLCCLNRKRGAGIRILALMRNIEKARTIYGGLLDRGDILPVLSDVTAPDLDEKIREAENRIGSTCSVWVHAAAVTASKDMVNLPVETIMTAIVGTENLLKAAVKRETAAFLYISSMEVYGTLPESDTRATEERLGYINNLAVRSNYPESKRMCENLCIAYHAEYHLPVRICRLSQTFGAGVLPWENRVFAQFARSVMNGSDIVLHTRGLSEGNYCYASDTMRAMLILIDRGADGEAYNISNESTHITIRGMAEMAAERLAAGRIRVVFDIPESNSYGYAADTKMLLDASKMRSLGWAPEVDLEEAYRRLIGSLKERNLG